MATDMHGISLRSNALEPTPPSAEEEALRIHLKLAQSLQTSLDTRKLLELFFQQLQLFVPVKGLEYRPEASEQKDKLGTPGTHRCDYRLTCEQTRLGQLIFSRDHRFSQSEQHQLEQLLASLVFPLRNALIHKTFRELALVDSLTGLGNRAALDNSLLRELKLAERHKWDLSLLAIDLDHFKRINDQNGHSYGDEVLRRVAGTIQTVCRGTDMSFRYGGEEFVVLLSNTDRQGAKIIAERIRYEIGDLQLPEGQAITASIGIGTRQSKRQERIDALFDQADRALYRAKALGRNRVVAETEPRMSEAHSGVGSGVGF